MMRAFIFILMVGLLVGCGQVAPSSDSTSTTIASGVDNPRVADPMKVTTYAGPGQ